MRIFKWGNVSATSTVLARVRLSAVLALGFGLATLVGSEAAYAQGYPGPFLDVFNELTPGNVQLDGANFKTGDTVYIYVWNPAESFSFIYQQTTADSYDHAFTAFSVPASECHHQIDAVMYDQNLGLWTDTWSITPHC